MSRSSSPYILCVGNSWFPTTPGGLNRYVYELTHAWVQNHIQVEFCGVGLPTTLPHDQWLLTNLAAPDMAFLKRLWVARKNFQQRYSLRNPQAINLHFALYSLPLLSDLPKNVPTTFTFHGPWAMEGELEGASRLDIWLKHWIEQRVYNHCDRFIVLSHAFRDILHKRYGVSEDLIHIIPGGVDTKRFRTNLTRPEARTQLDWPQNRQILFTPRRLVQRMGIDSLIAAIAQIKDTVPDIWLSIAGKGPLKQSLEQQVSELGLAEQVNFLGFLPDEQLPIAYQAADLTVIPSRALEGFGLVLLESLACGTPVMCTPVGGMPEILAAFSPDLIVENANRDAIASRLASVLRSDTPMPSRQSCRDYATENFSWSHISQQVQQVLLA